MSAKALVEIRAVLSINPVSNEVFITLFLLRGSPAHRLVGGGLPGCLSEMFFCTVSR
jgi:hypothetical protein